MTYSDYYAQLRKQANIFSENRKDKLFPVNIIKSITELGGLVSFHNDPLIEYICKQHNAFKFKLSVYDWKDMKRNRVMLAQALCFAVNECKALSSEPHFDKLTSDRPNFYEIRSANHIWALEFLMPEKMFTHQVNYNTKNDEIDVLALENFFEVPNKDVLIHLRNHNFIR